MQNLAQKLNICLAKLVKSFLIFVYLQTFFRVYERQFCLKIVDDKNNDYNFLIFSIFS